MIGSSRTSLLFLHLFSEYFLLDGACLCTSGCTLHPYTENSFLAGVCLCTSGYTLHPYTENSFLVGVCLRTSGYTLHPYRESFLNGWRFFNQTCFNSPSDLTQSRKSMGSLSQTSFLQPIRFDVDSEVDGQFNPDMLYSHHRFNKNFCKDGPHTLPSHHPDKST